MGQQPHHGRLCSWDSWRLDQSYKVLTLRVLAHKTAGTQDLPPLAATCCPAHIAPAYSHGPLPTFSPSRYNKSPHLWEYLGPHKKLYQLSGKTMFSAPIALPLSKQPLDTRWGFLEARIVSEWDTFRLHHLVPNSESFLLCEKTINMDPCLPLQPSSYCPALLFTLHVTAQSPNWPALSFLYHPPTVSPENIYSLLEMPPIVFAHWNLLWAL